MMKILHTGDWHFRPGPLLEETVRATGKLMQVAREERADLLILAGDLFDRSLRLESRAAREAVEAVRRAAEILPVLVVQGTPSHDVPGALDMLRRLALPNLLVMESAGLVALDRDGTLKPALGVDSARAAVAVLPEPTPASLSAGNGGRNPAMALKELVASLAERGRKAAGRGPLILAAHGTLRGAILPTGLPVPDDGLVLDQEDLEPFDYAALGHIHRFQEHFDRAVYCGSLVPQDFAEEGDHGFVLVELDDLSAGRPLPRTRFVKVPHAPVTTLDGDEVAEAREESVRGARVRVRIRIEEGQSPLEVEKPIRERLEGLGAAEVVFQHEMEVATRARAEGISRRESLWEKLRAWADAVGTTLHQEARHDLSLLEGAENGDEAAKAVLEEIGKEITAAPERAKAAA